MQIDSYVSLRRKKQVRRRGYFWTVAIFLAAYFIFLGIFLFVVQLPAFQVQLITIEGNSAVSEGEIMSLLQASIVNQAVVASAGHSGMRALLGFENMLIWPDALPPGTVKMIPQLAGITISKDYFLHTITVTVTERQPFAVWCLMPATGGTASAQGNERCLWFDNQGTAFQRTFDTQGNAIVVVRDYAQHKLVFGGKILPSAFVANLISIVNVLKGSALNIQGITLRDLSLQQVDVTTAGGPSLHFSLRFSAMDDLAVLKSLMAKPDFAKLQYIDFTVENRAYYK